MPFGLGKDLSARHDYLQLVALCGLVILCYLATQTLDNWTVLSFALLAFLSTLAVFDFRRTEYSLTDPVVPCLGVLFLQTVVYPGWVYATGNMRTPYFTSDPHQFIMPALLVWLVGLAAFLLGSAAFSQRKRLIYIPSGGLPVEKHAVFFALALAGVGVLGSAILIHYRGGLETILDYSYAYDSIRLNRGLGVFRLLTFASYVSVAYLGWNGFGGPQVRMRYIVLAVAISIIVSVPSLAMGRRGFLFYHLTLTFLPLLARGKTRALRAAFPLLMPLGFLIDRVTAQLRALYYDSGVPSLQQLFSGSVFRDSHAPLSFDQLELTAALMSRLEAGQFTFMNGTTFLAGALNWLPRKLFPDKGFTGGAHLAAHMSGGYFFDDARASSGMTTGLVLETYMNFGVVGTAIAMLLAGVFISWMSKRVAQRIRTMFDGTLWSLLFFFCGVCLFGDDFGGAVNKVISLGFGVALLYGLRRLTNRLGRRSRPYASLSRHQGKHREMPTPSEDGTRPILARL